MPGSVSGISIKTVGTTVAPSSREGYENYEFNLYTNDYNYSKGNNVVHKGDKVYADDISNRYYEESARNNTNTTNAFKNDIKNGVANNGHNIYLLQGIDRNLSAITNQINTIVQNLYDEGLITEKEGTGKDFANNLAFTFTRGSMSNAEKRNAAQLLESWFTQGLALDPASRSAKQKDGWRHMQAGDHIQLTANQLEQYWEALGFTRQKAQVEEEVTTVEEEETDEVTPPTPPTPPQRKVIETAEDVSKVAQEKIQELITNLNLEPGAYHAEYLADFSREKGMNITEAGYIAIRKGANEEAAHNASDSQDIVLKYHLENGQLVFDTNDDNTLKQYKWDSKRIFGKTRGIKVGGKTLREVTPQAQGATTGASVQNAVANDEAVGSTTTSRVAAKRNRGQFPEGYTVAPVDRKNWSINAMVAQKLTDANGNEYHFPEFARLKEGKKCFVRVNDPVTGEAKYYSAVTLTNSDGKSTQVPNLAEELDEHGNPIQK